MGSTGCGSASTTSSSNNVTIHWKGHADILVKGLAQCFRDQYLVDTDVTIRGETLKTHKMVLALFLPTFRKSVDDANGQLHGLNLDYVANGTEDVKALIEFVYNGTVSVSKDRLGHLGRLAECLQFDGLSKAIMQLCDVGSSANLEEAIIPDILATDTRQVIVATPDVRIKEEPKDPIAESSEHQDLDACNEQYNLPGDDPLDEPISSKSSMLNKNVIQAASNVHHTCHLCGTNYDSAESHTGHHLKYHKANKAYKCTACVTELRRLGCLESVSAGPSGKLVKYVLEPLPIGDGDHDQEDQLTLRSMPDADKYPNNCVTTSSAESFLKVLLREVKPDPDATIESKRNEEGEKAPPGPSPGDAPAHFSRPRMNAIETKMEKQKDVHIEENREYGCAFCNTFSTEDRVVWVEHMAKAHGLIRPATLGEDVEHSTIAAVVPSAPPTPSSCLVERLRINSTSGNPYSCATCDFRFSSQSRLDRHIRWMHPWTAPKRKRFSDLED